MYQRIEVMGHLGRDPEVRYMPSGDPVAEFSVAASERWKDRDGQRQERTEWFNCVAFKGLANVVADYLKKGSLVFVAGRIRTETWERDGQKHYRTKVVVTELKMISGTGDRSSQSAGRSDRQEPEQTTLSDDDFDDDIPF